MPAQLPPGKKGNDSRHSCARSTPHVRPPRKRYQPGTGEGLLATTPRGLTRFIDTSNCGAGMDYTGLGHGSRATAMTSTATSISWDGLTLDPRPFARFNEHGTLTSGKKPVGSAGSRVIELGGHSPGGIFGRPATVPGRIQWTVEQETSRVLAPDNPFKQAAADEGGVVVERPYFDSALAIVPKVHAVRPPTCLSRAGPQGDQSLLLPEERREMNNYEIKKQAAERVGRKARQQKTRLDFIMRHRYPEGAIDVDSPSNPGSQVHAEKRSIRQKVEAASSERATARRQRLDEIRGDPLLRFGYDPWQHPDLLAGGGIQQGVFGGVTAGGGQWEATRTVRKNGGEKFLQAKARMRSGDAALGSVHPAGSRTSHEASPQSHLRNDGGCARSETFINILGMREKVPKWDPRARSQALWDEGCGRRRYDIVSGAQLSLPTAKPERPPGPLAHPSQQSLERGRNLQGSLVAA